MPKALYLVPEQLRNCSIMNYHICILLSSQKQANNCHKGEFHLLTGEITLRQKTDLCDLTVETQGFYDACFSSVPNSLFKS